MPKIVIHKITEQGFKQEYPIEVGDRIILHLINISPDRFGGMHVEVVHNAKTYQEPEQINELYCASDDDVFNVIIAPAGPAALILVSLGSVGVSFAAAAGLISATTALIAGIALSALGAYITKQSAEQPLSNRNKPQGLNALDRPQNQSRLGSRVAEHYGLIKSWPDLIAPVAEEWDIRTQKLTSVYCLGTGSYRIENEEIAGTDLFKYSGATSEIIDGAVVDEFKDLPVTLSESLLRGFSPTYDNDLDVWTDWSELPGLFSTEIWLDLGFPQGFWRTDNNLNLGFRFEMEWRQVDDFSNTGTLSIDEDFRIKNGFRKTYKVQGLAPAAYEVRCRRLPITPYPGSDRTVDSVNIQEIYSVRFIDQSNYGKYTLVKLTLEKEALEQDVLATDYAVTATRILPNIDDGGNPAAYPRLPTRRVVDAIHHTLTAPYLGDYDPIQVSTEELLAIDEELQKIDGGLGADFNGTFDSRGSVETQLETLSNICRMSIYREGSFVRFRRDEKKTEPVAVFNRRNKSPNEDQASVVFSYEEGNDGIQVEWLDPESNWSWTTYEYPKDGLLNPIQFRLIGATNFATVWRFAKFSWDSYVFRRRTLSFEATEEGQLLDLYDLISVADNIDNLSFDGEIVSANRNTLELTLDKDVEFVQGESHEIIVRSPDGKSTETLVATQTLEPNVVKVNRIPNFIFTLTGSQVNILYNFGSSENQVYNKYQVTSVEPDRVYTRLIVSAYDERVFSVDDENPPANPRLRIV